MMAMSDYRLCDECGCKVFYDSNLNYEYDARPDELIRGSTYKLERLGDWKVLCRECAQQFECVIQERKEPPR